MNTELDYDLLYETAESQAGYFTTSQAREHGFSWERLSDNVTGEIHVIIPPTASRRRPGLRLHTNSLKPEETTTREGLPVTTAARTIADVAIVGLGTELVVQAIHEAIDRGLTSPEELLAQADYQGGRAKRIIYETLTGSIPA